MQTKMESKLSCPLSDEVLIATSFKWVKKLADTGGRAWALKVPVDHTNDPDIIFCELGTRLKARNKQLSHPVEQTVDAGQLEAAAQKANGYGVFAKNSEKYSAFNEGFIEGSKWQAQIPINKVVSQLEKIIGDAFDAGNAFQYTISPDKAQYIKQAIEQFHNSKK